MGLRVLRIACPLALLAGCASAVTSTDDPVPVEETPTAVTTDALVLEFDEVVAEFGTVLSGAENRGTARVRVSVATEYGGRARHGPGATGGGLALPAFTGADDAPAAALLVEPVGDADPLQPGAGDFAFGARFAVNRESGGDGNDDGNNLLQRGLFSDDSQYKIQVDDGVPSCRIAGSRGSAVVSLDAPVRSGRWFAIECSRQGALVSLVVEDLGDGREMETATVRRRTGSLRFDDGVPLAVGAKVASDGTIPQRSTDQFNGTIDGVFYRALP